MSEKTEELERAVEEVLELLDRLGTVDESYLSEHYGDLAPMIRDCLDLDEGLRDGAPPRVLSGYRVQRLIGTGATSRVYEGVPVGGGERVALKILHRWLADDEHTMGRFRREGRAGGSIVHANVVSVHETLVHEEGGRRWPVVVCELVSAPTLRERLEEGTLGVREAVRVGAEIADALAAAHAVGVVHRDLKPGNVAVTDDGDIKVLDLGLAWLDDPVARLTSAGDFVGTLAFAAPEQLNASWGPRDERIDLFALGVLLYEALTGSSPWGPARAESNALRRHALAPPRLLEIARDVPADLDALLQALLAARPSDRPKSASVVRDRLRALLPHSSASPCETLLVPERADAALRLALYQALAARPRAVVLSSAERERLGAFIDAWEGRLRRGALDVSVVALSERPTGADVGLSVAIARDVARDGGGMVGAVGEFVQRRAGRCALAVATVTAAETPTWLRELERAGSVRHVRI
jgi:hypothetical protein